MDGANALLDFRGVCQGGGGGLPQETVPHVVDYNQGIGISDTHHYVLQVSECFKKDSGVVGCAYLRHENSVQ